jgi:hypothetical protein
MHIYLSPHHDDICFSLSHLASRSGGDLVNLFTHSHYVAVALDLPSDPWAHVEAITRLRREEDLRFARRLRLVRHDLKLLEPTLFGRDPFDATDIEAEVASLTAQLVPLVLALLPAGEPEAAKLFCPMGIGAHRNHLSTLLAVRAAYETLRRRCTVFLYEDLPYATVRAARETGLRRAAEIFAGFELSGSALPLNSDDSARKLDCIRLYASQLRRPPRATDFIPASGAAAGMHEIVWQVRPPQA